MIGQFEEVKKALETIKEEWQVLANEFTELSSKVNEGNDTLKDEEWKVLQNILNDIRQELDILETEIQKVDISGTTVTLADLHAEMSEEDMKVACEKAEQPQPSAGADSTAVYCRHTQEGADRTRIMPASSPCCIAPQCECQVFFQA